MTEVFPSDKQPLATLPNQIEDIEGSQKTRGSLIVVLVVLQHVVN